MDKNNFCIIMAGGIGSRFWPLSKISKPKQFLDMLGVGKTLLQLTYNRCKNFCPQQNIFIITNVIYKKLVFEQIPELNENRLILEPIKRNTAPCIAYASYRIIKENPLANIVVAPSDHLITEDEVFNRTIMQGLEFTKKNNVLLTLGIKPQRPETEYGYIQICPNIDLPIIKDTEIRKVKTFTEKPEVEMAKLFCESGEFYWNSGIFIWSVNSILVAFEKHLKDVNQLFARYIDFYGTSEEQQYIQQVYSECRNISIDYGIMEKADNVYVLPSSFGWSDLGTWNSYYEMSKKDKTENVILSNNVMTYNTKGCIVDVTGEKLVVLQGLKDFLVAEQDNILLICDRKEEHLIRQIVNDVKLEKGDNYI